MSLHIPVEFNRKCRSLVEVKRWKATECSMFLLYLGPVVMKSVLYEDKFVNFLTLHVAITLLSSKKFSNYIDYADSLLKYFVETFAIIYGEHYISYKVTTCYLYVMMWNGLGPLTFLMLCHLKITCKCWKRWNNLWEEFMKNIIFWSPMMPIIFMIQSFACTEHFTGPLMSSMNSLNQHEFESDRQ